LSDAQDPFRGFELHRIDSFELLEEVEDVVARLIPPFRVAHALGSPALWCIASSGLSPGNGVSWIVGLGGIPGRPGRAEELGPLRLPSGTATSPFSAGDAKRLLKGCNQWIALEATLMPRAESIESEELRDAILAQLADRAFACMVRAVPAPPDDIDGELLSLDQVARVGQLQGRAEFASSLTSTELATERYGDLAVARQLGGWLVEIDVGAPTGEAPVIGELLAAALDMPGLSFQLEGTRPFEVSEAWRQPRRTFLTSTRQLATMLRGPSRELPGVALRRQMPFDLNAESDETVGDTVRKVDLGTTLDSALRPSGRFEVNASTLNRHALVCGATGSGKSQTVQHLLEQLTAIDVPWLVIEPAKSEYRSMHARLRAQGLDDPVHVVRIGDPDSPPLGLNPLEPEQDFPLQTHLDMVSALFVASFDAAEPFPQILSEALRRCYTDLGWVLATGEYKENEMGRPPTRGQQYPRYPTLTDLQRTARDVVYDVGYGQEVRDNVLGFVDVRLGSLRNGTPGRFFEGGHPLDLGAVRNSNVVIEIEDVGNDLDKAFVIGTVVLRLYEHLRVLGPAKGLTHVTVVEEAHRLLRRADPGAKRNQAVELFGAMLSEVRAFGEGIVIAEQIPTKILPDVLKNTALQIVHRLPSVEDRAVLAGTTNMSDDHSAFVVSMRPGHAAAFREGMDAPILLKVDYPGRLPVLEPTLAQLGLLRQRPRGVGCDKACRVVPCTGRILEEGPKLARSLPELPFWLELMFLAYVTETEIPLPGWVWAADLRRRAKTAAPIACAIGALVEETVAARWAQLSDFYDPNLLTAAMISATHNMLLKKKPPPPTSGFVAGRFLVQRVCNHLREAETSPDPHTGTAYWRDELGLDLIDDTVSRQLGWLELTPMFSYAGHDRLLAGTTPSRQSGPASRVEELAAPLANGVAGALGVAPACVRATQDKDGCMSRLSEWLGLTVEPQAVAQ
jgi:DNA helicase HerA-like ATPase